MKTTILHTAPTVRARIIREYRYGVLTYAEYRREDRRILDAIARQGTIGGTRRIQA